MSTFGTAVTKDQIALMFKYTNNIIFCFDGDEAGQDAMERVMQMGLGFMSDNRTIKFCILPDKEDPDSLIRKDINLFKQLLTKSLHFSQFFAKILLRDKDLSIIENKASILSQVDEMLSVVPSVYFKKELRKYVWQLIHKKG